MGIFNTEKIEDVFFSDLVSYTDLMSEFLYK